MGASSSNKLGCCKKISLETTQSCRISDSESWTCLPGRPRTSRSRLIMSSSRDWSIPLWSDREVNGSIGCDGKREIQGKVKRQRGNDQGITTCQGGRWGPRWERRRFLRKRPTFDDFRESKTFLFGKERKVQNPFSAGSELGECGYW